MKSSTRWFDEQSADAPPALRERAARYLQSRSEADPVLRLAAAADAALEVVLEHPGDRSVALDLLAADALVTLALQAKAARDPEGLATFAARLREARGELSG